MKQLLKPLILIGLSMLMGPMTAHAHKVTIFAWSEGDRIFTESKFSGGKRVKGGVVTVVDSEGNQLLEGRTDDQGQFSFKTPKVDDLTVVLYAGMGHANSGQLSAAEVGAPGGDDDRAEKAPARTVAQSSPNKIPQTEACGLDAHAVESIVARQLELKLQPLTRMLASAQSQGPTASDIFGGIGYILGLVGVGAYMRYRKENRSP